MAFGSSNGYGGRPGMMSDINVTPLVDVMLVLLIIFMVTAPMMTQGLDVNLPNVDATALQTTEEKQTVLTVKADGTVYIDDLPGNVDNLVFQLQEVMRGRNAQSVFLKADEATPYGSVAAIMGQLRQAGITNIGLVTEPADHTSTPPKADAARTGAPAAPTRSSGTN